MVDSLGLLYAHNANRKIDSLSIITETTYSVPQHRLAGVYSGHNHFNTFNHSVPFTVEHYSVIGSAQLDTDNLFDKILVTCPRDNRVYTNWLFQTNRIKQTL